MNELSERARPGDPISSYFGLRPGLSQFVPALMADFRELGSFPSRIVGMMERVGLARGARVLDLGCGKGAVALALARDLEVEVTGVDMVEQFIAEAQKRAWEEGLEARCAFRVGDIARTVEAEGGYDAVLLVSVGNVLGRTERTVSALRRTVRPGGLVVLDDTYATDGSRVDPEGHEGDAPLEETRTALQSRGDSIVLEELTPKADTREMTRVYLEKIERRAAALALTHPAHAGAIREYLDQKRRESETFLSKLDRATWILEKRA